METVVKTGAWQQVAEVELTYKTKVKASERPKISDAKSAAALLRSLWSEDKIEFVEQFKLLLLNKANLVLGLIEISSGGVAGTVADPKLILVAAIKANVSGIILAHNHPSGNLKPSNADIHLTQKVAKAAELLDVKLMDHIIISKESYCSFADEGLL